RERPKLDLYITVRVVLAGALSDAPGRELALAAVEQRDAERLRLGQLQQALDGLQCQLVGPVQILEDDQQRPLGGQAGQEVCDHLEASPVQRLVGQLAQVGGGATVGLLEAQQVGQERVAVVAGTV